MLSGPEAKPHFHLLQQDKEAIEREVGEPLEWRELTKKKESHILINKYKTDPGDRQDWEAQHEWLREKLELFHRVFATRIKDLRASDYLSEEYIKRKPANIPHTIASPTVASPSAIPENVSSHQKLDVNNSPSASHIHFARKSKSLGWIIGSVIALLLIAILSYTGLRWYQGSVINSKGDDSSKTKENTETKSSSETSALAPEIELKTLQGEQFRLNQLRGRVVVLNFWATRCIPCREQIPVLNSLQDDFGSRGLEVVGISLDDLAGDVVVMQKGGVKQNYTIVLGGKTIQDKFGGVSGLPTTYIIDRKGQIRQKFIGGSDRSKFNSFISPLLDEAP